MGKRGPAAVGTGSAVNSTIITLNRNRTSYTVDASSAQVSKFENSAVTSITVGDIKTGDMLVVKGIMSSMSIKVDKIFNGQLPAGKGMPHMAPAATGTISSINGNIITLTSSSVTYVLKSKVSLGKTGVQTGDII